MRSLKRLFGINKNPMLTKLEESVEIKLKEVFYFFGFAYTEDNYLKFKNHLEENSLERIKKELEFDVTQDNLEIFFVKDFNDKTSVFVLIDYFEPLYKERILEQISLDKFPTIDMEKLK